MLPRPLLQSSGIPCRSASINVFAYGTVSQLLASVVTARKYGKWAMNVTSLLVGAGRATAGEVSKWKRKCQLVEGPLVRFRRQVKMTFLSSRKCITRGLLISLHWSWKSTSYIYIYICMCIYCIYIYCLHELYTQPLYTGEILYSEGAGADRAGLEHT